MRTAQPRFTKLAAIAALGALSMGNESCQQSTERVVRMEVEVGSLGARPVTLPNGETVDFPYVVNTLFYRQVMNNPHFMIQLANSGVVPMAPSASGAKGVAAKAQASETSQQHLAGYTARDLEMLADFGFLKAPAASSGAESFSVAGKADSTGMPTDDSKIPACLYSVPLAKLGGSVISFAAEFGVGLAVGYQANGTALPGGVGGSVEFSASKLEMGLRWDNTLRRQPVAIADGIAHQANIKFAIGFNPGVPIGLSFFYNTPIQDAIRAAMDRGLASIVAAYVQKTAGTGKTWKDAWEGRVAFDSVISNNDTHIAFRGGGYSNVEVGDTFTVANMRYKWKGAECASELDYSIPLTDPIAEVTVERVGDAIAVAKVTKYRIEQRIRPGAQMKIMALNNPAAKKEGAVAQPR